LDRFCGLLQALESIDEPFFSCFASHRTNLESAIVAETLFRSVYLLIIATPSLLLSPLLLFDRTEKLWWRVSLLALAWAGPCFLKFGQWAATRPDLFSARLCERLSELHDGCPAHSFEDTQLIIRESLGKPLEEIFSEFAEKPIASGTVAQVRSSPNTAHNNDD
jgi:aarF domain-containing kinase